MNSITQVAVHEQSDQTRRTRHFRKSSMTRAMPDVVSRQAQITLAAFRSYELRTDALLFLNDHSTVLGGRPLDIAGQDDAGLVAATSFLSSCVPARNNRGV